MDQNYVPCCENKANMRIQFKFFHHIQDVLRATQTIDSYNRALSALYI